MKNRTQTQGLALNQLLKFFGLVFKSLFTNPENREFKRLKDFISS